METQDLLVPTPLDNGRRSPKKLLRSVAGYSTRNTYRGDRVRANVIETMWAMTRRVTALGAAVIAVLTLGASGCGGGSDSSSSEDRAGSTQAASTGSSPKELRVQAVAQAIALQSKISDCFEQAGATVLMHVDTPDLPHSSADIPGLGAFYYFAGSREDLRNSRYAEVLVSPEMSSSMRAVTVR